MTAWMRKSAHALLVVQKKRRTLKNKNDVSKIDDSLDPPEMTRAALPFPLLQRPKNAAHQSTVANPGTPRSM